MGGGWGVQNPVAGPPANGRRVWKLAFHHSWLDSGWRQSAQTVILLILLLVLTATDLNVEGIIT